jgi:hypothetical protein
MKFRSGRANLDTDCEKPLLHLNWAGLHDVICVTPRWRETPSWLQVTQDAGKIE